MVDSHKRLLPLRYHGGRAGAPLPPHGDPGERRDGGIRLSFSSRDTDPNLNLRLLKNLLRNVKATAPWFLLGVTLTALYGRYVPAEWAESLFGQLWRAHLDEKLNQTMEEASYTESEAWKAYKLTSGTDEEETSGETGESAETSTETAAETETASETSTTTETASE